MIRYDVLWHKLRERLSGELTNASNRATYANAKGDVDRFNHYTEITNVLGDVMKHDWMDFREMQKRDEEVQHNANVTLQEILKELRIMNGERIATMMRKEEKADGELDREGDDPGSESSGEQEDHLQ